MVHRTVRRHQRPVSFLKLSWYWQLWGYLIRTQRPEMLVNYRWIWSQLSWQIWRLTFTFKHIEFHWCYLLHPANEAIIPSNFSPVNCISKQHQCANITLWDTARILSVDLDILHISWAAHVISLGARLPSHVRSASVAQSNVWRTP